MGENKFNKILTIFLVIVIIGIFILIGYFTWSALSKYSINTNAEDAASSYEETVKKKNEEQKEEEGERLQIGEVDKGDNANNTNTNKEKQKYYGYDIVGTISIPKINIKYPILGKSTTQSIKVAVAYLSGVGINKVRKYSNPRT